MILTCMPSPPKLLKVPWVPFLERINKIKISIEEPCGVFQLRVMTDVFVQNGHRRPLDQPSAGTKNERRQGAKYTLQKLELLPQSIGSC